MERDEEAATTVSHWEQHYAGAAPVWSGQVNATLAAAIAPFAPGRSIDLGSGEGGDVLWLAERGWDALGLDVSPTAVDRAREAAAAAELKGSARFEQCDLTRWRPTVDSCELVTASFFHSRIALERTQILRRAAGAITVGGHLVLVSHAAPPPWAAAHHHEGPAGHHEDMLTAQEEATELALPADSWALEVAEQRQRDATGPDGQHGHLEDSLLVLRRTD